jgi:hypothetical protein
MAGELILIVEDNDKNRKLVRDVLTFKGYTTIEAETGEAGVRLAQERRPSLVLMDIRLPGSDGMEAPGNPGGAGHFAGPPRYTEERPRPGPRYVGATGPGAPPTPRRTEEGRSGEWPGRGAPVDLLFRRLDADHGGSNPGAFARALRAVGLPGHLTVHSLRHSYASLLLQRGESPAYVQRQLGHASIQLTVDTYGKWLPAGNKAAANRLDDPSGSKMVATRPPKGPAPIEVAVMIDDACVANITRYNGRA